jgi:hypothetical protein
MHGNGMARLAGMNGILERRESCQGERQRVSARAPPPKAGTGFSYDARRLAESSIGKHCANCRKFAPFALLPQIHARGHHQCFVFFVGSFKYDAAPCSEGRER